MEKAGRITQTLRKHSTILDLCGEWMKKKVVQIIAVLATISWMLLIFGFSAQSGEASGSLSAIIAQPITRMLAVWRGVEDTTALYIQVDGVIRSAAHFSEYAVLGALLLFTFRSHGLQQYSFPLASGAVYAILDEWHQAYSPGRVCDPLDMAIDVCGVLAGILTICLIRNIWRKQHV